MEEARRRGAREGRPVGAQRGGALLVAQRLGDRAVERDDVDRAAGVAQRIGDDVARVLGARDEHAPVARPASASHQRLADRALGHQVGLDAARAQRRGRARADRRDRRPGQRASVAHVAEELLDAVGRRQHDEVEAAGSPNSTGSGWMRMAGASIDARAERAQARRQAAGLRAGARHRDADAGQRPRPSHASSSCSAATGPTTVTAGA